MNRLIEVMEKLSIEELHMIKKDVESGNMERLINKKINSLNNGGASKICPVCHGEVDEDNDKMLVFGPRGLRKKAVFCANDCLEYFLDRLKAQEQIGWRKENGTC